MSACTQNTVDSNYLYNDAVAYYEDWGDSYTDTSQFQAKWPKQKNNLRRLSQYWNDSSIEMKRTLFGMAMQSLHLLAQPTELTWNRDNLQVLHPLYIWACYSVLFYQPSPVHSSPHIEYPRVEIPDSLEKKCDALVEFRDGDVYKQSWENRLPPDINHTSKDVEARDAVNVW